MILVISFLFKGENFSFVTGLWLLDLDNRKTVLVEIFWISFASGVLRWWLESLLIPSIREIVARSIYFWESLSFLQEGDFNLGVFSGGPQFAWIVLVFYQGVFISVIAIYDFFLLFFVAFSFFSHVATNLIWLTFVMQERGRIDSLGQNVEHRTCLKLLKLIGIEGIIIQESTRISR